MRKKLLNLCSAGARDVVWFSQIIPDTSLANAVRRYLRALTSRLKLGSGVELLEEATRVVRYEEGDTGTGSAVANYVRVWGGDSKGEPRVVYALDTDRCPISNDEIPKNATNIKDFKFGDRDVNIDTCGGAMEVRSYSGTTITDNLGAAQPAIPSGSVAKVQVVLSKDGEGTFVMTNHDGSASGDRDDRHVSAMAQVLRSSMQEPARADTTGLAEALYAARTMGERRVIVGAIQLETGEAISTVKQVIGGSVTVLELFYVACKQNKSVGKGATSQKKSKKRRKAIAEQQQQQQKQQKQQQQQKQQKQQEHERGQERAAEKKKKKVTKGRKGGSAARGGATEPGCVAGGGASFAGGDRTAEEGIVNIDTLQQELATCSVFNSLQHELASKDQTTQVANYYRPPPLPRHTHIPFFKSKV